MPSSVNLDIPSGLQFAMIFFYLVLAQVSLFQLSRLIYNKHPLLSFQAWFLLVSLAWCGERAVTFVFSPLLSQSALTFLWVLPSAFQCISFSLLVLYSRFLLNQHRWSKDRYFSLFVYFTLNTLISISTITIASLLAWPLSASDSYTSTIQKIHTSLYSIQFTVLLGLYGYYAYHLRRSATNSGGNVWHNNQQSNASSQFWISLIAWGVFFSQWLYYVLATIDPNEFRLHITAGSDNILDIQWPVFLVIVVWEIVPTSLVLFVSREIPPSEDTLYTEIQYHGFFKAIFCCPTTRGRRGMGNGGMLYENLTSGDQFSTNNGLGGPLYGISPHAALQSGQAESIFGNASNLYPHQATYQVLNDDGGGVLLADGTTIVTGSSLQGIGPITTNTNNTTGLMMDYGLVDGGVGREQQQQQQQRVTQQLQSYSNHFLLGESMSDMSGLPVNMGGNGNGTGQGQQQGGNSVIIGKQQQQLLLQQQLQQQKIGSMDTINTTKGHTAASPQTGVGQNVHPVDLLQLHMKSQLNQHLAQYNNYDDGGDLF